MNEMSGLDGGGDVVGHQIGYSRNELSVAEASNITAKTSLPFGGLESGGTTVAGRGVW